MLTTEQLADLRAKAEAATPGPWKPDYRQMYVFDEAEVNICCQIRGYGDMAYTHSDAAREAQMRANNAFIVAANPVVILKLLDMIARLEKERDWLAVHAPAMNEYGDYWCPYRLMSQDKKCPMWTPDEADVPDDASLEEWKLCAFGDYDSDTVNCGTNHAKCWKHVASKAVEEAQN